MFLVNNYWKTKKDYYIFGESVPLSFQTNFFSELANKKYIGTITNKMKAYPSDKK